MASEIIAVKDEYQWRMKEVEGHESQTQRKGDLREVQDHQKKGQCDGDMPKPETQTKTGLKEKRITFIQSG
jgi:hypothetical protein